MTGTSETQPLKFVAERIKRSASFVINGTIDKVFPLFGPVREEEWAEGWKPGVIYSENGLVEEHMIFQTAGNPEEGKYTWVITQFIPMKYLIEYTVSTAARIWFVRVECKEAGEKTKATVSYTYTGLTEVGNHRNKRALEKMFEHNLTDWEEAINHYLKTGKKLTSH
jgi:hypothetical protein